MLSEITSSLDIIIQQTQANTQYLEVILLVLFGVFIATRLAPALLMLGIWPRHLLGLPGIFLSPFLHVNFNHLFFNSIPLIVLSNFILMDGLHYFIIISIYITVMSGFLVWCFAKPGIHLGASGVITGYWGFLVCNIVQQGTLTAFFLGAICIYYFAGIFLGIFPTEKAVSWEGHLFGLVAGITTSFIIHHY